MHFAMKNAKKEEYFLICFLILNDVCGKIYCRVFFFRDLSRANDKKPNGGDVMLLQFFFPAGLTSIEITGLGYTLALILLACLLGALVAGILILLSKVRHANTDAEADRSGDSSNQYHHGAAFVLLGAVPAGAFTALSILAWVVALVAVFFLILLIVIRVKGYAFLSPRDVAALSQEKDEPSHKEEPAQTYSSSEEEQRQEAYTSVWAEETFVEEAPEEEAPLDVFDAEQSPAEETSEETAVAELLPAVISESAVEGAPAPAGESVGGNGPYKIVEKIVTETQKEIIREVPAASSQKTDSATEQLMEKLTDFLDYELQKRKEADQEASEERKNGSVATFAKNATDPEDEELDDEDEIDEDDDLEDGEEAKGEEDDIDDEEPDSEDRFTGNERIIGFDEATGCYIVAHYRKSFEAKLIQARPRIKQYYSELKNALLSYKGTKSRISWTADSFHNGRTQIAKINVKTNILELYLALEPETLEGTVYRGKNVGSKKKYADTPFLYKLRTPRKFKWAMELVQRTCEEHGLSPIDIEKIDYEPLYPFESTESLVARKLIKEYIREEKPATSFELAPDHVPSVPDEDESVIPANANFSWEFDNDVMTQKEEAPEEVPVSVEPEPTPEPEVEAEPKADPAPAEEPAPATEIVRETVKITEMRYTERYYANGQTSYEEVISTEEPVTVETVAELAEAPAEEPVAVEAEPEVLEDVIEPEETEEAEEAEEIAEAEEIEETEETEESEETEVPEEETDEDSVEAEDNEEYFFDETPAQPDEEFVEEEYTEEEYTEEEYTEEEYTEEEYTEEEYTEEEYTEEEYTEEEYTEEEYTEEEYTEEEAPEADSKVQVDPTVAVIDICAVADSFADGDTVNLQTLKDKGLVISSATTLKIYATGTLDKPLSVEANHFTLDAIFAISGADGDTSMLY